MTDCISDLVKSLENSTSLTAIGARGVSGPALRDIMKRRSIGGPPPGARVALVSLVLALCTRWGGLTGSPLPVPDAAALVKKTRPALVVPTNYVFKLSKETR